MTARSSYSEKLRDPRWQKKRLEILERDHWCCQICFDEERTLAVHHRRYIPGRDPWDYPEDMLVTLCETCHEAEKDGMDEAIGNLIDQIKDKFFSGDIHILASAINGLQIRKGSDVTASLIEWAFRNNDLMRQVEKYFFEDLKNTNKANNNGAD